MLRGGGIGIIVSKQISNLGIFLNRGLQEITLIFFLAIKKFISKNECFNPIKIIINWETQFSFWIKLFFHVKCFIKQNIQFKKL